MAWNDTAASRTVFVSGPMWSIVHPSGITPRLLIKPKVGFKPVTPQNDAGMRIDPPVSVPVAKGTDTGGSIRIPASFCGVTGLKPTFGLISKRGVMPLGWTMDHMGPITRTVRDCAVAFHAMGGPSVDLKGADIRGLRIGLPVNYY